MALRSHTWTGPQLVGVREVICMFTFGYFPGVKLSFADVSEPSVRSIFKGWMKKYPKENIQVSEHGEDLKS
jgi:hypothetical protein